jgi:hypothetical protein
MNFSPSYEANNWMCLWNSVYEIWRSLPSDRFSVFILIRKNASYWCVTNALWWKKWL